MGAREGAPKGGAAGPSADGMWIEADDGASVMLSRGRRPPSRAGTSFCPLRRLVRTTRVARTLVVGGNIAVRGIALIIDAVNIILKHLGEKPDGPEVHELRERALGYINEAVLWKDARPRPSVEKREALMKKVLALHVEVKKLGGGDEPRR
jgi:hypothetical protein